MHIEAVVGDELDYSMDWTTWLPAGVTISSSVWTVTGTAATPGAAGADDAVATQWLTAAAIGSARVANKITTSAGHSIKRLFVLDVVAELST